MRISDWSSDVCSSDLELVVEAKRELFPRDVRQQIWQLRDYLDQMDGAGERVAMLIAGAISKGARDILQQESIGYFDLGGSLFIPAIGRASCWERGCQHV